MVAVAAVHGRRRRRPRHPVRRGARASAPATSPSTHGQPAGRARDRAAGPEDPDPGRRGQHDRDALRREPGQRPARPDLADHGQGDRRDRGLPLLPARRPRPEGHAARAGHQPGQRRRRPGWLVDHPADGQADPARPGEDQGGARRPRPTTPTRARSASCATRSPSRRSTPRTGSSSATSTSPTSATAPTASRRPPGTTSTSTPRTSTCASRRCWPGWCKNPTGYDPTNSPDRALAAPQRRAGPDGRAQRHHPREGRQDQGAPTSASTCSRVRQRLRLLARAVLLRLRPQLPDARTRALGKTPEEREQLLNSGGLTIRTTIDLRDAGGRRPGRRATTSTRPTRRSAALAMVEPGTGEVKALAQSRPMGRDEKPGETYLNYVGPEEVRRLRRLPGGLDVQGVRARRGASSRASRSTRSSTRRRSMIDPRERASRTAAAEPYGYGTWDVRNYDSPAGTSNLYTGTQQSVNTFFAQLEQRDRALRAVRAGQEDGRRADQPDRRRRRPAERVPSFTLGVADASPLEMAEAYATFAARGLHCDSRPVTAILDSAEQPAQGLPPKCNQVMSESDRRRGQRHPRAASSSRRLRLRRRRWTSRPPARPAPPRTARRCGSSATRRTCATAAMIAGANEFGSWPSAARTARPSAATCVRRSGSGFAGPDLGRRDEGRSTTTSSTRTSSIPSTVDGQPARPTCPRPSRRKKDDRGGRRRRRRRPRRRQRERQRQRQRQRQRPRRLARHRG